MTYQATLDYLFASLPMYQRIGQAAYKKDLTNTLALSEIAGNPHKKLRCIHVAGTNGKGSSTHFLAAILIAHGLRVGIYTSPHYKDFRERIKINDEYIDPKSVVDFIQKYKKNIDDIQPSFFEMTVVMAFDYFAQQNVDIAIIEVGLGGRLDSTNIISPLISVITNISLDHQAMLGETLPEIAGEKAGIIKSNTPVVISETQETVKNVFLEKAKKENAALYFADKTYEILACETDFLSKMRLTVANKNDEEEYRYGTYNYELDALGKYQIKNILGVLKTIDVLNEHYNFEITPKSIEKGLANVKNLTKMQGRWQILEEKPLIIADSGHNEGGLSQTMQQLDIIYQEKKQKNGKLHFILGVVNDKTLDKMLTLLPKHAIYYFAKADIPRGLNAETLKEIAADFGILGNAFNSVQEALDAAKNIAKNNDANNDIIFVGGSCFMVAEVI